MMLTLLLVFPFPGTSYDEASPESLPADYLIVTCEEFVDEVQPLAIWKLQRGLIPAIETVEDISSNYEGEDLAEKIRNCIMYYNQERNATWVVLAGGHSQVPTRRALIGTSIVSCDHYYANLHNNWTIRPDGVAWVSNASDWECEVYVGRLPADTDSQMSTFVDNVIQYERNPPVGSWMTNALFGGTFCNFNYDINGNDIFDEGDFPEFDTNRNHNMIFDSIFPSGWSATFLAETEGLKTTDYYYDRSTNSTNLAEEIEAGVSIAMFDAHGSTTGMYRTLFTEDYDGDVLFDPGVDESTSELFFSAYSDYNVSGKLGFYFLCACSTGTFRYPSTCLSEAVVRKFGIGCIASSESAGYDPFLYEGEIGWSTQGLAYRFWEQLLAEGKNQPGKAFVKAKIDYVTDFAEYTGEADDDTRTLVQYNLMGDPEVPIWTAIPDALDAEIVFNSVESILTIKAVCGENYVSGATVTLTNSHSYYRGVTDTNGVQIPLASLEELDDFDFTISKNGYLAYQQLSNESLVLLPDMSNVTIIDWPVTTATSSTTSQTTSTMTSTSTISSSTTMISTISTTTTLLGITAMTIVMIISIGGVAILVTTIVVLFKKRGT